MANKYPLPNGTTLTTDNFNDAPKTLELMMQAVDNGISSTTDYEQNASLLTTYINAADFFEDTGTANAYNLVADGGRKEIYQNINGGLIRFRPLSANTGASTINVSGLGVKNLLDEGGNALVGGELSPNRYACVTYDGTAFRVIGTDVLLKDKNLSGLTNLSTARTNLGLGQASIFDKSSGSDITAGNSDALVITPLALKNVMSSSITDGTGWATYSNGIITNQFKTPTISSGGSATITLPAAYTSSTSYSCFATLIGGIPNQSYTPAINRISNTQITIGHFASAGSAAVYSIFAIGI